MWYLTTKISYHTESSLFCRYLLHIYVPLRRFFWTKSWPRFQTYPGRTVPNDSGRIQHSGTHTKTSILLLSLWLLWIWGVWNKDTLNEEKILTLPFNTNNSFFYSLYYVLFRFSILYRIDLYYKLSKVENYILQFCQKKSKLHTLFLSCFTSK